MAGGSPFEQSQPKDVFEAAFKGSPFNALAGFMRGIGTSPEFNSAVSAMSEVGNVGAALAQIDGSNKPEVG